MNGTKLSWFAKAPGSMTLSAGARLGGYEVLAPVGTGGMGEVWRARDPVLGRDVAIKVLGAGWSSSPDMLRRFEQEARAAAALNHPNVLSVFHVGTDEGTPYIVCELLAGQTLRERLREGPLPLRRAVDYAQQVARGLAAAHDKGIVHRDLKPENVFLTQDGRVKILDFGLAKLPTPAPDADGSTGALDVVMTEPGTILGTMGYMSPEQLRGKPADHRSDMFAFGALLYEMLTGRRAFQGDTAADTISAILGREPPDLLEALPTVPPVLERIVRGCLEKDPEARLHSAHDLAFALEGLTDPPTSAGLRQLSPARRKQALAAGAAVIALAGAFWAGRAAGQRGLVALPTYQRLTFRMGTVYSARFAPDDQTIVYAAAWQGQPPEVFTTRSDSRESRALGISDASLLAVSPSGELAVALQQRLSGDVTPKGGTLARVPLAGGAPRAVLTDVFGADWSPGGALAVVHRVRDLMQIELPIGHLLYGTSNLLCYPRVSPDGERVAFLEYGAAGEHGSLVVVDTSGRHTVLATGLFRPKGVAWRSAGELWFGTADPRGDHVLQAVTLDGRLRRVARVPGWSVLADLSRDGRALVTRDLTRAAVIALPPGSDRERDLSWLDATSVDDISVDGRMLLLSERGQGGGGSFGIYLRKSDGSPAVRLGDGLGLALSPDLQWVLATDGARARLSILPTGAGEARALPSGPIQQYRRGAWTPSQDEVVISGSEAGHGVRVWVQKVAGGAPRPLTLEGVRAFKLSPDGRWVAVADRDGRFYRQAVAGGPPEPLPGFEGLRDVVSWSAGGRALYARGSVDDVPAKIVRLDVATGRREPWKDLSPADRSGLVGGLFVVMTPDATSYAYDATIALSDLYLVDGLR